MVGNMITKVAPMATHISDFSHAISSFEIILVRCRRLHPKTGCRFIEPKTGRNRSSPVSRPGSARLVGRVFVIFVTNPEEGFLEICSIINHSEL
jgi:hypothetical protein